ncbi:hypothetical protein [Paenibacillus plantarum]|uniref:hypothetical protein n=1 Tax=Paenibacillus plantarum TaxID=2654975 RepID=UPI001FE28752|nr:hypothetical protein [Paenibacillus plantarum]
MEFNICKIVTSRENYIEFLQEKDMRRIGQPQIYISRKLVSDQEVVAQITTDFFFKTDSEEVEIEWINYWGAFFGDGSNRTKTVESTFGMIIIQLDDILYAVSLGRAHSYASSLSDMDFGFDIAEVIHDEDSIEVKAAKFFKQSKNKSLTQYNRNSFVTSEIGESHEFLISNITLDAKYSNFLLYKYDDKMKFGSSVKFEASAYQARGYFRDCT